jgi:hypothetical protein
MIGSYPNLTELELADRPLLEPLFRELRDGLSELSFAGIYCFRASHAYRIGRLADGTYLLIGADKGIPFFICPFGLPRADALPELFERFSSMKLVTEAQAEQLRLAGYEVTEDRDNFDYLYRREDLAALRGRALQRKRNLVHAFEKMHSYEAYPFSRRPARRRYRHPRGLARQRPGSGGLRAFARSPGTRKRVRATRQALLRGRQASGLHPGRDRQGGHHVRRPLREDVPDLKGLYQLINMDFVRSLPAGLSPSSTENKISAIPACARPRSPTAPATS